MLPLLNIGLLTSTFERGGACRVLTNMANYWAGRGFAVTLFSFEDGSNPPYYLVDERVRMVYLDLNSYSSNIFESIINNCKRLWKIRQAVRRAGCGAVISFIDSANVRTLLALAGLRIPVVVSERIDPAYEDIGRVWNLFRRLTYPLATHVVVQTRQAAPFFSYLPSRKVIVIPNPVVALPLAGGGPVLKRPALLAVGRMYPQKAYGLMLRAFAKCSVRHPDWTLSIAGDGPLWDELHNLAEGLGIVDKVRFLGQVRDMGGTLAQADAYVLASAYEGFPNSLCEAMAAGLPCISTDCPSGPSDIITHGEDGLLVPNGDEVALAEAMWIVMADGRERARLGSAARSVLDRFSEDVVMDRWEACLFNATGKG